MTELKGEWDYVIKKILGGCSREWRNTVAYATSPDELLGQRETGKTSPSQARHSGKKSPCRCSGRGKKNARDGSRSNSRPCQLSPVSRGEIQKAPVPVLIVDIPPSVLWPSSFSTSRHTPVRKIQEPLTPVGLTWEWWWRRHRLRRG